MISSFPILAQLDRLPDGYLVWWLIAFGGLALIVQTVLNVADRFRAKKAAGVVVSPDPLRVEGVERAASREELLALQREMAKDIEEIRGAIADDRKKSHGEIVAIHNRINVVAENTTAISGRLEEIATTLKMLLERHLK